MLKSAIALLFFAAAPATAQTLWQNVDTGMTESQVLAAQPTAMQNPEPTTLSGGAKCSLHIKSYALLNDPYEVCFFFLDKRLIQVTLGHRGELFKGDYEGLVDALASKYGEPLSNRKTSLGFAANWSLNNGVNISVFYMDKLLPLLNLVYQTRLASDAEKL